MYMHNNKKFCLHAFIVGLLFATQCTAEISQADRLKISEYAQAGNTTAIEDYAQRYTSNVADNAGNTLLNIAVQGWIDAKNSRNETFFFSRSHWRAYKKQKDWEDLIKYLLERNTDIDLPNKLGLSPICNLAQEERAVEMLELLLKHSAKLDRRNKEFKTPLHLAVEKGLADNVRVLLYYKANPNIQDNKGNTPLHYYAMQKNDSMIPIVLIRHGADPNKKNFLGQTALHKAVENEQFNNALALLNLGAYPSLQDNNGNTALHQAVKLNDNPMIELLVEKGADTQIINNAGQKALPDDSPVIEKVFGNRNR